MILLGTGLSGLVGSRIVEILSDRYDFEDISRKTGTDITDFPSLLKRIKSSGSSFLLHFAAYTDVEQAEKDRTLKEESLAWQINVEGTQNVVRACQEAGKHLIAFSTDMVFPGTEKLGEKYNEDDPKGPTNWYAKTKYEAEKVILESEITSTILRIAYPYRASYVKNDSVRIFLSKLRKGETIKAVTDHYFTPTFIDDLAPIIDKIVKEKIAGVFHAGGSESVSPFEVAHAVARVFSLDRSLITPITREDFFQGRAQRPFNLSLNNAKIENIGIHLHSLAEGLGSVKEQIGLYV